MLFSSLLGILPCQLSSFYDISLGQTRAAKHRFLLYFQVACFALAMVLGSVSLLMYYLFVSYVCLER